MARVSSVKKKNANTRSDVIYTLPYNAVVIVRLLRHYTIFLMSFCSSNFFFSTIFFYHLLGVVYAHTEATVEKHQVNCVQEGAQDNHLKIIYSCILALIRNTKKEDLITRVKKLFAKIKSKKKKKKKYKLKYLRLLQRKFMF